MAGAKRVERTLLLACVITLLGLALRVGFLLGAEITSGFVGDEVQYWNYAWNLANHHVFSLAVPSPAPPEPDAWRGPGYPAFLAACLALAPDQAGSATLAQWLQVLFSALLAPMAIMLGRRFLPASWALAVGLLVAIWPHLIVFAGTFLSETLFAFSLLLAALAISSAFERGDARIALLAGVLVGLAWLVNPILMFFPPSLAALAAWRGKPRVAATYLLGFLLVAGAWQLRNSSIGPGKDSMQRVAVNFVQGSWPMYHDAYRDRFSSPIARAYNDQIEEQAALAAADPRAGLNEVFGRMAAHPSRYLQWYLVEKPWLLWDWSVRIGWGDVYFLQTLHSPFDRVLAYRVVHEVCRALNPVLFALALAGCCIAVVRLPQRRAESGDFSLQASALLVGYLTAIHIVLQAEPRYSIPYRPFEILLAAAAALSLLDFARARARP